MKRSSGSAKIIDCSPPPVKVENINEPRHEKIFSAQSDQRLCYSLLGQDVTFSFYIQNFKTLASLFSRADRFESYLVKNPEDMFSHDKVQMHSFAALLFHFLSS